MNIFDTSDPATIGMLIVLALIFIGTLIFNHFLAPLQFNFKKRATASTPSIAMGKMLITTNSPKGEQPRPGHVTLTASICARTEYEEQGPNFEKQWDRIADHLDTGSSGINQAALDHASASTQLHAAEFSLSELFREFPDARQVINPVTYVDFPDQQSRNSDDENEDQYKTIPQIASA